jgi:prepilin-type N-terminal cleavage/methylation domain-containing protein
MNRNAFTLVEMLIVVAVIAILAALALAVYFSAAQQAKVHRTRAIVAKLDGIISEKWEAYRTRAVPLRVPPGIPVIGEPFADTPANADLTNGIWDVGEPFTDTAWRDANGDGVINNLDLNGKYDAGAADLRMIAMREMQRCELPNLMADVLVNPVTIARPSVSKQYLRRATATWTNQFEGAECLYLIVAATRDGDSNALDWFSKSEIGDVDADGMREILDAWGQPIEFVRWPFGYRADVAPSPATPQTANDPDPFDPFKADGRTRSGTYATIALKPLIYSAGSDKVYAIQKLSLANPNARQLSDPYRVEFGSGGLSAGSPFDANGGKGWSDNITSHDLEAR